MIIITGSAGFIGSNLVAEFEQRYPSKKIVVCDWFEKGDKWRNLSGRAVYDFIEPEMLFDFIQNNEDDDIEAVFHMGASSSTTETDVDFIMSRNYQSSMDLWKLCTIFDIRFIYASSAATYGDGNQGFDDDQSLPHLQKLHPLNPYGWSKHIVDKAIIQRVEAGEPTPPQWAGLKFFNVYGPNEYHKGGQKSVVAGLYPTIKEGKPAKLFKSYKDGYVDGGQLRDFVWVGDCVNVMMWLYENPTVSGIFNVGTGQARTFEDLAKAVFLALGKKPKIEYFDMPETLRDKYQYFTEASMKKLQNHGYNIPFTSLEEGVKNYVQNFLEKENPYR